MSSSGVRSQLPSLETSHLPLSSPGAPLELPLSSSPATPGSNVDTSWRNVKVSCKLLLSLSQVLRTALEAHGSLVVGKYHHIITILSPYRDCLSSFDLRHLKISQGDLKDIFLGHLVSWPPRKLRSPDKLFPSFTEVQFENG